VTASYSFKAELWLYPGEAGWHFLTLPAEIADDVRLQTAGASKAFGSIKVTARVGGHSWQTSLFRDAQSGSYLLPLKKAIRDKARISEGDEVAVQLSVQDA
jgi:predicted 2-oxoglutarate/Fe(II)-dependent dioxygenase YbiX